MGMVTSLRDERGATCLGCGCACDDIDVVIDGTRIVAAGGSCPQGAAWFGDGVAPARARVAGEDRSVDDALECAAQRLSGASRTLVYLAPGISCEAQRRSVGLADRLRAAVDSVTSTTTRDLVLAFQERGMATATLGEIRHRADLVVFWGVDPAVAYPRYAARFAPDAPGLYAPDGRRSRVVMAVDIGARRGPTDADIRVELPPSGEVPVLTALRALVMPAGPPSVPPSLSRDTVWGLAASMAPVLAAARYIAVVADAEWAGDASRSSADAAALIAFVQALNGPARAALSLLRAGGNRNGADAVLTSQTGYPMAVDFSRGYPRYRPHEGTAAARLDRGEVDAVLVVGAVHDIPADVTSRLVSVPHVVIGARACESTLGGGVSAIDAATVGIHESGLVLRMDDVPLSVRALVEGPPTVVMLLDALTSRLRRPR